MGEERCQVSDAVKFQVTNAPRVQTKPRATILLQEDEWFQTIMYRLTVHHVRSFDRATFSDLYLDIVRENGEWSSYIMFPSSHRFDIIRFHDCQHSILLNWIRRLHPLATIDKTFLFRRHCLNDKPKECKGYLWSVV